MTPKKKRSTFRVDNQIIQHGPNLFGAKKPKGDLQLSLPGDFAPFGPFDQWATLALYSLLDPKKPTEPVKTTMTELIKALNFAKEASQVTGYDTYPTDAYEMVEEALHRLFTVEVDQRSLYNVLTDDGGRARQAVVYRGRILVSFEYVYAPGVTPPGGLPPSKLRNVNKAKTASGEAGSPIYKIADGKTRPVGIRYRFAPDMVAGLTGGGRIGSTVFPFAFFALRPEIGNNPTATRLAIWVIRQTAQTMKRSLDGLAAELNLDPKRSSRNRDALTQAFDTLKKLDVIESFEVNRPAEGGPIVTFTKGQKYHFARMKALAMPWPEDDQPVEGISS